jgi:hypothetical protein
MGSKVPSHEHRWYPIADDPDGEHVLFACAVTMRCIKTITAKEYRRLKSPPLAARPYDE